MIEQAAAEIDWRRASEKKVEPMSLKAMRMRDGFIRRMTLQVGAPAIILNRLFAGLTVEQTDVEPLNISTRAAQDILFITQSVMTKNSAWLQIADNALAIEVTARG